MFASSSVSGNTAFCACLWAPVFVLTRALAQLHFSGSGWIVFDDVAGSGLHTQLYLLCFCTTRPPAWVSKSRRCKRLARMPPVPAPMADACASNPLFAKLPRAHKLSLGLFQRAVLAVSS